MSKRTSLELAIASRMGDAMVQIANDVGANHNLGNLLTAARNGDRTIATMTGVMSRAARADDTLYNFYGTRASRVLPSTPAESTTPAGSTVNAD